MGKLVWVGTQGSQSRREWNSHRCLKKKRMICNAGPSSCLCASWSVLHLWYLYWAGCIFTMCWESRVLHRGWNFYLCSLAVLMCCMGPRFVSCSTWDLMHRTVRWVCREDSKTEKSTEAHLARITLSRVEISELWFIAVKIANFIFSSKNSTFNLWVEGLNAFSMRPHKICASQK